MGMLLPFPGEKTALNELTDPCQADCWTDSELQEQALMVLWCIAKFLHGVSCAISGNGYLLCMLYGLSKDVQPDPDCARDGDGPYEMDRIT